MILRGLGAPSRTDFTGRVRELAGSDAVVMPLVEPLLSILATMLEQRTPRGLTLSRYQPGVIDIQGPKIAYGVIRCVDKLARTALFDRRMHHSCGARCGRACTPGPQDRQTSRHAPRTRRGGAKADRHPASYGK